MAGFLETVFRDTKAAVELRACRNDYAGGAASMMTSGGDEWKLFAKRHDRDGWGVYFGACTRRIGSPTGKRADLVECPAVWVDIDCRKLGVGGASAIRALDTCPYPPSIVVNSGNGLHAYWILREPVHVEEIDGEAERRLVAVMRQLVGVFAGDRACCELARILRLPGTHNSKDVAKAANEGEPIACEVMTIEPERRYELSELEDWLAWQRPLITATIETTPAKPDDDVFAAYARKAGLKPPLDVSAAIATMRLGGEGETSIHETQVRVSASMVTRGHDDDEIVTLLMRATMEAAGAYAGAWNWRREEANLRGMIATARTKFPAPAKPKVPREAITDSVAGGGQAQASGGAVAHVVDLSDARKAKKAKATAAASMGEDGVQPSRSSIEDVTRGVVAKIEGERGKLMTIAGNELYLVERGVWRPFDTELEADLDRDINGMCRALQKDPKPAMFSSVRNLLRTMPELYRGKFAFNRLGWVACDDASINVLTGEIAEHDIEHLTTIRVGCNIRDALAGDAGIVRWRGFLDSSFANRSESDRAGIIETLQEWMGAALVRGKPRETTRALIIFGEANTGKTRIAVLVRNLLGGDDYCASIGITKLDTQFGMEPLIGKTGWISDDGIGEGDALHAENFKRIVTGESNSIARKNRRDWEGKLDLAVLVTANDLPKIRDSSNAVYSRCLLLPMTIVHGDTGQSNVMDAALHAELPGILLWAIAGYQKLLARGRFDPPAVMRNAVDDLRMANNPIQSWLRDCVAISEHQKVHRKDMLACLNGWMDEHHGTSRRKLEFSLNTMYRRLKVLLPTVELERAGNDFFYEGVKLTGEGLAMWERYKNEWSITGKNVAHATGKGNVNCAKKWDAPF